MRQAEVLRDLSRGHTSLPQCSPRPTSLCACLVVGALLLCERDGSGSGSGPVDRGQLSPCPVKPDGRAAVTVLAPLARRCVARRVRATLIQRRVRCSYEHVFEPTPPCTPSPPTRGTMRSCRADGGAASANSQSGRWQARYPHPDTGAPHHRPRNVPHQTDAARWLDRAEVDQTRGEWTDPTSMALPLGPWGERWIKTQTHWKPKTRADNESLWKTHIEPRFGGVKMGAVRPIDVQEWVSGLTRESPALADGGVTRPGREGTCHHRPVRVKGAEGVRPAGPDHGRRRTQPAHPRHPMPRRPTPTPGADRPRDPHPRTSQDASQTP
jgi:hypothetical protein